jgi:hypothetical protein
MHTSLFINNVAWLMLFTSAFAIQIKQPLQSSAKTGHAASSVESTGRLLNVGRSHLSLVGTPMRRANPGCRVSDASEAIRVWEA